VKAEDAPQTVERLLKAFVANRATPDETFFAFTRRYDVEALTAMCTTVAVARWAGRRLKGWRRQVGV
jgi:ferredoxin-nitrite reductase